jgi:cytochrome c biogenesis protein CcmG/thiol:disulfide interchange protein DsbE
MAEAPRFVASARRHRRVVAFLGLDLQDLTSDAREFLRRFGINYVSVHDGSSSTSSHYGLTGIPETYYIDARGRIVGHSVGQVSRRELGAGIGLAMRT